MNQLVKEAIDRILKAEKQADEIENDAVQTVKQIESETTQTVAAIFDQAKKQTEIYRQEILEKAARFSKEEETAWIESKMQRFEKQYEIMKRNLDSVSEQLFLQLKGSTPLTEER